MPDLELLWWVYVVVELYKFSITISNTRKLRLNLSFDAFLVVARLRSLS